MEEQAISDTNGIVAALALSATHAFSKRPVDKIVMVSGHGVAGDAHAGSTVQHRSRVAKDPSQPNRRQVHLLHAELLADLRSAGFIIAPGQLGENVTTSGIALLDLPQGTVLRLGREAELQLTGLRNPCRQIEAFQPGLLQIVARRTVDGSIRRLAGVMAIVRAAGEVRLGDRIEVLLPPRPWQPLEPV